MSHEGRTRREFLGMVAAGAVAGLTPSEAQQNDDTQLLGAVDDKADLELIRRMVQIPSYSEKKGEGPLAKYLVEYMKGIGLEARLQEVEPNRYNAIGILRGSGGGKSMMMNGHIDTNPVGESWTVDPHGGVVKDGCVFGIGVSNMKASCAAYVGAARALLSSKTKLRGDLIITHVVGELSGGVGTKKVVQSGLKADYFIVGEPTDLVLLTVHMAGGASMLVNVIGQTRHMSKLEEAVPAIDLAYKVMERLKRMKFTDSSTSTPDYVSLRRLTFGKLRAGLGREFNESRYSMVPDFAQIQVSIRTGPDLESTSIINDVRMEMEKLRKEDPNVVTEVVPTSRPGRTERQVHYEIAKDHIVVRAIADAYRQVVRKEPAIGPIGPARFYGTDADLLQAAGMEGLVCGVGGRYNTMPDERVELTDFHAASRIYALATLRLCA